MIPDIPVKRFDRPDARAEALAVAIMSDAFDPYYGEAWTPQQLSAFTLLPGVNLSIAQLDGATLGFALTRQVVDEVELMLLAVARSWQGKGIGKLLVNHCIAAARRNGGKILHLEVRANNSAISFYDSLGFEYVHRRPSYYKGTDGATFDALSYRLEI